MRTIRFLKKRLIQIFAIGFSILLLILFIRTFTKIYEDVEVYVWSWFLIITFPVLLLLFQVKDGDSRVLKGFLIIFAVLYAILVNSVILINPDNGDNQLQPLLVSSYFIIPIELFLLFTIWKQLIKPFKTRIKIEDSVSNSKAFISYNHENSDVALKIKDALEKEDFEVIIDTESMNAGENISKFIKNSIQESAITISLVSNKSLTSAWVAMETINSFLQENNSSKRKKLIACYLDEDFFKNEFTLNAIEAIDKQIKENQELISQYS